MHLLFVLDIETCFGSCCECCDSLCRKGLRNSHLGAPNFTIGATAQGNDANKAVVAHPDFSTLSIVLT